MGEGEEGAYATVSALVSLVEAVGLVADNRMLRNQPTTAEEVLQLLRIEKQEVRSRLRAVCGSIGRILAAWASENAARQMISVRIAIFSELVGS